MQKKKWKSPMSSTISNRPEAGKAVRAKFMKLGPSSASIHLAQNISWQLESPCVLCFSVSLLLKNLKHGETKEKNGESASENLRHGETAPNFTSFSSSLQLLSPTPAWICQSGKSSGVTCAASHGSTQNIKKIYIKNCKTCIKSTNPLENTLYDSL